MYAEVYYSCGTKGAYPTPEAAERVRRLMAREGGHTATLHKCRFGRGQAHWHLTHKYKGQTRRKPYKRQTQRRLGDGEEMVQLWERGGVQWARRRLAG